MSKKTKLSENAEIYQIRTEQSEKEKLREMSFKEKVSYLWEYYRMHAFVFILVVAITSSVVYNIVKPKIETKLYAAMINNVITEEYLDQLEIKFAEHLELDPAAEKIELNPQFQFGGSPEYTMNLKQVLTTYVAAQDVDIIIAPESEFSEYALYGYMSTISDLLPTDLYTSLADQFYITKMEVEPGEEIYEEGVFGIYLTDTKLLKEHTVVPPEEPYLLGIVANSRREENVVEFIRYLFDKTN